MDKPTGFYPVFGGSSPSEGAYAPVGQLAESAVSKTVKCEFESHLEHMKKYTHKYRCQNCNRRFDIVRRVEKNQSFQTKCIYCGHLYVDWLNWKKYIESLGDYGRA